jgi:hypothetical protein
MVLHLNTPQEFSLFFFPVYSAEVKAPLSANGEKNEYENFSIIHFLTFQQSNVVSQLMRKHSTAFSELGSNNGEIFQFKIFSS